MLTYTLDPQNACCLYEQLYFALRSDIETGKLEAASKLPSKRAFAQHLGISVITVESAYRQLAAEGYIEAQERRGYFVSELRAAPSVGHDAQSNDAPSAVRTREEPLALEPSPTATSLLADFSGRFQSASLFPYSLWAKTVRQTLNEASKGRLLHTANDNRGAYDLRAAIAEHLDRFRGLEVSPEQIVIGAGAQDLYGVLVQLLGREHLFAIEDPGYPALRDHYELSGAQVVPVRVDSQGLVVSELEATNASIAHCTPAHQFPTGVVMSAARRRDLLLWAQDAKKAASPQVAGKRYIIEDDYDSEFRMRGRPIPPLYAQDRHESVIYMNTFTRSLGSVFRIAYMVLPTHLLSVFAARFAARSCTVGSLDQLELARFIMQGDYERHVSRQRNRYRKLQDALIEQLAASAAGRFLTFRGKDAGLHVLMDVAIPVSTYPERKAVARHAYVKESSEIARHKGMAFSRQLESCALEHGIRLVNIDEYCFAPASQIPGESTAVACPEGQGVDHVTYVMNVSGLDAKQVDQIAAALSAAIMDSVEAFCCES